MRLGLDYFLRPSLDNQNQAPRAQGTAGLGRRTPSGTYALLPLIQRLGALLIWLIGMILVLDHFGQNVSSVVAAFGVTSLAIGLAAQQALSNIIAGLVLAVDHPFRPGDRIKLSSGESGMVIETGMRATQIRLWDGNLLVVPNADLVSGRIINQTTDTLVRAEVRVSAPTTIDVDQLSSQLLEEAAVATHPEPLPQPPRVMLLSVADKVELAVVIWLPRGTDTPFIEEKLRRAALKRLQAMLMPPPAPPPAA
jgi:small-conductance mechanosensitive channel